MGDAARAPTLAEVRLAGISTVGDGTQRTEVNRDQWSDDADLVPILAQPHPLLDGKIERAIQPNLIW